MTKITISVSDTGIGMSAEVLPKIFQPSTPNNDILKEQIKFLQYNLNIDYNAGLVIDGVTGKNTLAALKEIQDITKSHLVLWIQQKLEQYGYLKENSYIQMLYNEATF